MEKQIKKVLIFLVFLCLLFFGWEYSQQRKTSVQFLDQNGRLHVLSLPVKDKKKLCNLMRLLFAEDSFAYTLLGSKPISWACYIEPLPFIGLAHFCDSWKKYHRTLRLGWKAWEKYRHLFPSTHFWKESSKRHPGWVSIVIANEECLNGVITAHKKDFLEVLNREVDGHQLLDTKDRSLMDDILNGHQALIGIVLGYGRDNSWEFLERLKINQPLGCVWGNGDKIREGGMTLEECLALESLPSFAGNPNSEESLALKREYLLTQQKVINYFQGKDFLEATLSLLAGFRP